MRPLTSPSGIVRANDSAGRSAEEAELMKIATRTAKQVDGSPRIGGERRCSARAIDRSKLHPSCSIRLDWSCDRVSKNTAARLMRLPVRNTGPPPTMMTSQFSSRIRLLGIVSCHFFSLQSVQRREFRTKPIPIGNVLRLRLFHYT